MTVFDFGNWDNYHKSYYYKKLFSKTLVSCHGMYYIIETVDIIEQSYGALSVKSGSVASLQIFTECFIV